MDNPLAFGICEPSTPCTFKDRADFSQSNSGRTLRSDLTPEIYPLLQCTLLVFIQIWRPSCCREFWMGSNDHKCFSGLRSFCQCCVAFDHWIFLDLSSICLLIIATVLKPSLLLYFPSMTNIRCPLNICQQQLQMQLLVVSVLWCTMLLYWCAYLALVLWFYSIIYPR